MEVEIPVLTHLQSKTRVLARLGELTRAFAREFTIEGLTAFERKRDRLMKLFTLHDQGTPTLLPHAREFRFTWGDGQGWILRLDQGVGYWRACNYR